MNIADVIDFSAADAAPERYLPAAEKILAGQPWQRVWNRYSSADGRFSAGHWEGEPGHWQVNYSEHEYCEILAGHSVLHDQSGGRRELQPGDRFVIPAGFRGSWEVLETTRKVYVIFEPGAG